MVMLTVPFPETIDLVGGPTYDTDIARNIGGTEKRNINRTKPIHRYSVNMGARSDLTSTTMETWKVFDAFFRKAKGRANSFRVKDWMDYQCARAEGNLSLITSTTFQLNKLYGTDEPSNQEVRKITRLVSGTLQLWKNTVLLATPADYTVNIDTRVVTYATAPGAATLEAAFDFWVPCRFDFDEKRASLLYRDPRTGERMVDWDNIEIIEDPAG